MAPRWLLLLVGLASLVPAVAVGRSPSNDTPSSEVGAPDAAVEPAETPRPVTRSAEKILEQVGAIEESLQTTRYQHRTVVRRRSGLYAWDCSGMANWLVRRVSPRAFAALRRERPVARSYWRVISKAPVGRSRRGWQRLAHIEDVRPGDVFAWVRPAHWPKGGNTGHIGFAMDRARPVDGIEGAYTLRIVDATSLPHQDDTRDREGEGGFGRGTLMFMIGDDGRAWAYGWFGTNSRGVIPTDIVFGRLG